MDEPEQTPPSPAPIPSPPATGPSACAVIDPGPRPYTVTDMVVGVVIVLLLEIALGSAVANASSSAAWGVVVGLGTFLIFISLIGLRLRAGIGQWLTARRLARTNLDLVAMGNEDVPADELCSSILTLRRCTADDASPLRRHDIDQLVARTRTILPRVWVLSQQRGAVPAGELASRRIDELGRSLTPCRVVRESLGRASSTASVVRLIVIVMLAIAMVLFLVTAANNPCLGCVPAAILFFIIAGLLPSQRVAFADRELAASPEGLWLVLSPRARQRRERALEKRAARLGVQPADLDASDEVVGELPDEEIRIPWRACYAVLTRPRAGTGDSKLNSGTAWHWRIHPPKQYWSSLRVGGPYVIEADGVDPRAVPWTCAKETLLTRDDEDERVRPMP